MIYSDLHFGDFSLPVLAFAIHNGHHLPSELEETCGIDAKQRFQEEDPFTDGFAECFPNRIIVQTSRFAVDLNRSREKCVYQKPEDAWGLPVRKTELSPEMLAAMFKAYDTWYGMVKYETDKLLTKHERLLILDLHSFNHRRGGPDAEPDSPSQNPDIIIGRNNNPQARYPLFEQLRELLDGKYFGTKPLDCRCDVKFPGGYFSRWMNATFGDRVICPAIEFKKTFMDEWSGELNIHAYLELKALFHDAVMQWLSSVV
jgi:N-formylglutamate amidohydrolase